MWSEQFKDRSNNTKYRFYEKYKDPYTDKWKRVSVVMNKNTKASQKEAMFKLEDKIKEKSKQSGTKSANQLTLEQAIDEWFEHFKIHSGVKQSTLKTKSYNVNLLKSIFPSDTLIKNITPYMANEAFNSHFKKKYSKAVNKEVLGIYKHAIKHAHRNYRDVDIMYLNDLTVPKVMKSREQILNDMNNYLEKDQLKAIIDYFYSKSKESKKDHHKRMYLFSALIIEFQALNGMRIGELQALTEEDVDFNNKTLDINGTIQWGTSEYGYGVKDSTKTDISLRKIGLTERSCQILKKAMLENKVATQWNNHYNNRGFIFTNYKGNPIYTNKINQKLKEAAEVLNINKNVTSHTLRHTNISFLSELGMELKTIMKRVGHSNPETTIKIYTHITEKMEQDMMDKLENFQIM
jgi:integrase